MKHTAYYWYRPHPYFSEFFPGKILKQISDIKIFFKYLPEHNLPMLAKKYFDIDLGPHGLSMLCPYLMSDTTVEEAITEIIFEYIRKIHFPEKSSRFSSVYASESIETAQIWKKLWEKNFKDQEGQVAQSLWEIEFETPAMIFDASFLDSFGDNRIFSPLLLIHNAHMYWYGAKSNHPLPELLIPYPVTVVRKIWDSVTE